MRSIGPAVTRELFTPLEAPVEIPEHMTLELPDRPERNGFTVVEWGGSVLER